MKKQQHYGWAIACNSPDNDRLIGVYWWFDGVRHVISKGLQGYESAVFNTRKEARHALRQMKTGSSYTAFPNAKVVKVKVTVEWED